MDTLLKAGDIQVTRLLAGATPLLLELTHHRPEDSLLRQEATHLQWVDTPKRLVDSPLRLEATLPLLEDTLPKQEGTPHSLEQEDTRNQQVEAGDQLQVDTERREELLRVTPLAPPRDKTTQQALLQDKITQLAPPRVKITQHRLAPPTRGMEADIHKLLLSLKDTGVQSKTFLGLTR